jgi:hypothetical protein
MAGESACSLAECRLVQAGALAPAVVTSGNRAHRVSLVGHAACCARVAGSGPRRDIRRAPPDAVILMGKH